jgi:hypothetical protein
MLYEVFRVKVANQYGDFVIDKRIEWVAMVDSIDMTFTCREVTDTLWLIMPKLDADEWDMVKVGGNHRFRKLWFQSLDGRYVLYVSARKIRR